LIIYSWGIDDIVTGVNARLQQLRNLLRAPFLFTINNMVCFAHLRLLCLVRRIIYFSPTVRPDFLNGFWCWLTFSGIYHSEKIITCQSFLMLIWKCSIRGLFSLQSKNLPWWWKKTIVRHFVHIFLIKKWYKWKTIVFFLKFQWNFVKPIEINLLLLIHIIIICSNQAFFKFKKPPKSNS
jgi:hypothetical protein